MIYELAIRSEFSAAHWLRSYKGIDENIHGHNWAVEALIGADEPDEEGMVMDFVLARECLDEVLNELDHRNLNDLPYFIKINPTAEHVARFIYDSLEKLFSLHGAEVKKITLWETPQCAVVYRKPEC